MQCDDDALHLGVLSNVLCLCESSSVNMVLCRSFVLYWKEQALKATVLCYCFHPTQAMGGRPSVLCVGVGVAGGWKLVFTVLC